MAEAYLRHRLKGTQQPGVFHISSCGTLGIIDDPPASAAVAVMAEENGIDLAAHRSRALNREKVEEADLILVMEKRHRRHLKTLYPAHGAKVRLLSEFAPPGSGLSAKREIFDPVGMEPEAFRECYRMIRTCLDGFVSDLEK